MKSIACCISLLGAVFSFSFKIFFCEVSPKREIDLNFFNLLETEVVLELFK
jgi:hypothetical protein